MPPASKNPLKLAIFRRVCGAVDADAVAALQREFSHELTDFHPTGPFKYADIPFWVSDKINTAIYLGLHESDPKAILDIGMGGGHFAAVCKALGHTVVGTDISVPIYNALCRVLQVDRRLVRTQYRTPMPPLGAKFDLITVIGQVFNVVKRLGPGRVVYWDAGDWAFFLKDLVDNHLSEGGSIFLHLNPNLTERGVERDPALFQWARDLGAQVDEYAKKILFKQIASSRLFDEARDQTARE